MKKIFLSLTLSFLVATAFAQTPLNYYGLNFSNGQLKLAEVNVSNGALNLISSSPTSPDQFESGVSDIDGLGGRYFYIRAGRIYTVSLTSGTVTHSPAISCANPNQPCNASASITNIAYDPTSDVIYGIHNLGGVLYLASIDPISGAMTILSQTAIGPDGYSSGVSDIDPYQRRFFYISSNRLYIVNLDNGNLINWVFLSNPNGAIVPIINIAYNFITQKVYGLNMKADPNSNNSHLRFAEININTGTVSLINQVPLSFDEFSSGVSDLNPFNNSYTYVRGIGSASQIITVDLATGTSLYSPLIQNPNGAVSPITNIACPYKVDVVPVPSANFQITVDNLTISMRDISPYAAHFHWGFGDGSTHTAQHPNHTYTTPGTYNVQLIVTNEAGSDTLEQQVIVEGTLASAEGAVKDEWTLYPNPSQGRVILTAPESVGSALTPVTLSLLDGQGRLIWKQDNGVNAGENELVLPNVAEGVYFLNIVNGEEKQVKRLVIRK